MNRRAFLTGLVAAAAAPAIAPAVVGPAGKFYYEMIVSPVVDVDAQAEITRRVAEYWTRKLQSAFVQSMHNAGMGDVIGVSGP